MVPYADPSPDGQYYNMLSNVLGGIYAETLLVNNNLTSRTPGAFFAELISAFQNYLGESSVLLGALGQINDNITALNRQFSLGTAKVIVVV